MKSKVIGLDNKAAGDIDLAEDIFGKINIAGCLVVETDYLTLHCG